MALDFQSILFAYVFLMSSLCVCVQHVAVPEHGIQRRIFRSWSIPSTMVPRD